MRKIFIVTGLAAALLAPMYVDAQFRYTARDIALLPPYCKYTQSFREYAEGGNDPEKIKQWYSIMGGSYPNVGIFHVMHHYCRGLINVNTAKLYSRSPQERQANLNGSIIEFDFVIERAPPDAVLLPEILTKKGESLIAVGKGPLAVAEFNRAIQLKPDYWPPFAALSDYYKTSGNIKMARELLQQGLSASPNAAALKRRLAELDSGRGKPKAAPGPGAKE